MSDDEDDIVTGTSRVKQRRTLEDSSDDDNLFGGSSSDDEDDEDNVDKNDRKKKKGTTATLEDTSDDDDDDDDDDEDDDEEGSTPTKYMFKHVIFREAVERLLKMGVIESPFGKDTENDEIWQAKEWKDVERILLYGRKPMLKHEYVEESDSQIAWVLKDVIENPDDYSLEYQLLLSCYGCNNLEHSSRQLSEFESSQGNDEDAIKKKRKECSSIAQKMFKPGNKIPKKYQGQSNEKTNHVAYYITNKWPVAAFDSLKSDPPRRLDTDMRTVLLTLSLRFIKSSWVIDKKKKLEVLKEKQGLDWHGLTDSVLIWAKQWKKKNESEELVKMAEETKTHLDRIMDVTNLNSTATSSNETSSKPEDTEGTTTKPAISSEAEKEAIRIRRESMRARMRGSATSLSSMATAAAAPSLAPVQPPLPPPPPLLPAAAVPPNVPKPPSRWQQQDVPPLPPPPPTNQPINPSLNRAPSPMIYQPQAGNSHDGPVYAESNGYQPAQQRAPSPHQGFSSDPRASAGGFEDVGQQQYGAESINGTNGYASNGASQYAQPRDADQPPPRNPAESNEYQPAAKRSRWEDRANNSGQNNERNSNNHLPPQMAGGDGGRGRGRGLSLTRPAWMTADVQGQDGPTGLDGGSNVPPPPPPPPPDGGRLPLPVDDDGALGRGRGRGRTLPAW
eukprot:CAMPEP_0113451514 /NCGR_PEP_ID=MMETSP0014_2-20120614/6376_1 /TAXON_ID=2857 /ORGANISM="Nitzschia sp." /LENGTH=672 /DNA_ID=CAMNT_0000342869 /DNA_START=415 /DNA_END=2430 /DNA_ORIENTATION=- /assembly_acc=CAM_ASM_000159